MTSPYTPRSLVFASAIAAVIGCAVPARADETPTPEESKIHDMLMRHPEWLVEMSQTLRQKQQSQHDEQARRGIAESGAALFRDARDTAVGNPNGDVAIVIFQDKECPYCKAVAPVLAKLVEADSGVRVIYKEFPILGPGSTSAARAVLASARQGRFADFNARLLADKTPEHQLTEAHILDIARDSGIDADRLTSDMASPTIDQQIADTKALAAKLGINGTPGIVIGDEMVPGNVTFDQLVRFVNRMRQGVPARSPS